MYGRPIDVSLIAGPLAQAKGELPYPELYPPEWLVLLKLWLTKQERSGEGIDRDQLESETLIKTLEDEYDLATPDIASALNLLSRRVYIKERKKPRDWIGVRLPETPWTPQPVKCVKCGKGSIDRSPILVERGKRRNVQNLRRTSLSKGEEET